MKRVDAAYTQEETRGVGARPKLMAEVGPFDVDFGLAPGSGTYVNCSCTAGNTIVLDRGYITSASWTSEIGQAYLGQITAVIPACTSFLDYTSLNFSFRSAATPAAVLNQPFSQVALGQQISLAQYFQCQIEASGCLRVWALDAAGDADAYNAYGTEGGHDAYLSYAVDGEFPGKLQDIRLSGLIAIDESDIMDCQDIIAARPTFFHDIRSFEHTLTLDNRGRQWIPGHQNFLMADGLWYGKELRLYTGFELPTRETSWVLQYLGRIKDIRDITNSFSGKHQAKIVSVDYCHDMLQTLIGVPQSDGTRSPYLSGTYKARADLQETADPSIGSVTKRGTGGAELMVIGKPTNTEDVTYLIEAESTGEISAATFRWSIDGGASWEKTGIVSVTSASPFRLQDGLSVYFVPGAGNDLVAGDQFTFTAYARVTKYVVTGYPFTAFTNIYFNGVEIYDYEAHPDTGEIYLKGHSGFVDARIVKSETSNPVDIITDILQTVGLSNHIDTVSFGNTKQALADYQIGVRFETVPAWKAIQAICTACLLFFWSEAGRIYLSAYTG